MAPNYVKSKMRFSWLCSLGEGFGSFWSQKLIPYTIRCHRWRWSPNIWSRRSISIGRDCYFFVLSKCLRLAKFKSFFQGYRQPGGLEKLRETHRTNLPSDCVKLCMEPINIELNQDLVVRNTSLSESRAVLKWREQLTNGKRKANIYTSYRQRNLRASSRVPWLSLVLHMFCKFYTAFYTLLGFM